jgi:sRNA-binding protein
MTEMATASPKQSRQAMRRQEWRQTAEATVWLLIELYPACFVMLGRDRRPLKIGIHADILARAPSFPEPELSQGLAWYTGAVEYQRALMRRKPRIDLDGNDAGQPTPEEAEAARLKVYAAAKRNGGRR